MHAFPRSLFVSLALLLPMTSVWSAPGASTPAAPLIETVARPAPPPVKAPSYLLMDYRSGKVLASKDPDAIREPASLTKMMTAYVVFSEIRAGRMHLTDQVTISERAWRARGTRTFLDVRSQVAVEVLLKGLLIQSGNDAAIALAEHAAGSEAEFAKLMNRYAAHLGMRRSHFVNPHGLPNRKHYSTARDLAILARAQFLRYPEYRGLYATKEFTWNNIRQHNRNRLLWRDDSVDGIKTGYTARAKYCQAASAARDGERMISVVLGSATPAARTRETQALLDYGFQLTAFEHAPELASKPGE